MDNHSQQENPTSSVPFFTPLECIAWLTVFGIESVAIVTLNVLTIIIYLKERSLRKRSMYLVINQAVSDMFVGSFMIVQCSSIGRLCDLWTTGVSNRFYSVIAALLTVFPSASLSNLVAISLERTHATFRPFKHRIVKTKFFGAVIAVVWFTAVLFATSMAFNVLHILQLNRNPLFWCLLFLFLIIPVSYSSIAIKIVYGNQPHHCSAISRERKLTKTLFMVTIVSLLLPLPHIILLIYYLVSLPRLTNNLMRLDYSIYILFLANSFVNPILYTFRIPEFRRALFSFLRRRRQPHSAQIFPLNER